MYSENSYSSRSDMANTVRSEGSKESNNTTCSSKEKSLSLSPAEIRKRHYDSIRDAREGNKDSKEVNRMASNDSSTSSQNGTNENDNNENAKKVPPLSFNNILNQQSSQKSKDSSSFRSTASSNKNNTASNRSSHSNKSMVKEMILPEINPSKSPRLSVSQSTPALFHSTTGQDIQSFKNNNIDINRSLSTSKDKLDFKQQQSSARSTTSSISNVSRVSMKDSIPIAVANTLPVATHILPPVQYFLNFKFI